VAAQHRRRRRGLPALLAALLVGMIGSAALVWSASGAAFSGQTGNPVNGWSAASVAIGDDDSGTASFAVTGAMPGDSGSKCLTVTYSGTATSTVKVYAGGLTGGLGPYLNLTVAEGSGGSFASCTGFVATSSTSMSLTSFAGTYTTFATGFGSWNNAAPANTTRTYQISWSLAADNAAVGTTAAVTFTWEAQNN
jgi:hypothetical protein